MHYEDCHRCHTPKIPGHRIVCVFHGISEISFWAGILCLLTFWLSLVMLASYQGGNDDDWGLRAVLFGSHAGLLLILSLATGMRAKWLRHAIVADMEEFLDEEGSCCGGACAGSCGDGACAVDESALPPDDTEEGGCCGGGCCS